MNSARDLACDIAFKELNKPYIWGGNDGIAGFDCSGLMVEILKSVGRLPYDGDWSAGGLYDLFKNFEVKEFAPGCLVFYGTPINHVEMVIEQTKTHTLTIGAMGGGSKTLTLDDAIKQDAYVKIRPVKRTYTHIVDPFSGE